MKYSDEYLNEIKKRHLLEKLDRSKQIITQLQRLVISKGDKYNGDLDNETKNNLLELSDNIQEVSNFEMEKGLSTQKSKGKEFITDDEIDHIIKNADELGEEFITDDEIDHIIKNDMDELGED